MAQATVDEINAAPMEGKNENISSTETSTIKTDSNQPNVRHIPIFVEGRDEPIINKNFNITPETIQQPAPTISTDYPDSIFNRVKHIPVRKPTSSFEIPVKTNIGGAMRAESPGRAIPIPVTSVGGGGMRADSPGRTIPVIPVTTNIGSGMRAESPARTIPIKVEHVQTKPKPKPSASAHPSNPTMTNIPSNVNQLNEDVRSRSPSPMPPKPPMDSITKIQLIQKEILELMDKVGKFNGKSRKDKEYLYLDEMLTQNLLKLDTIDTEGKENIKAARKEAINCINKCISALEAKVENAEKEATSAAGQNSNNKSVTNNDANAVQNENKNAEPNSCNSQNAKQINTSEGQSEAIINPNKSHGNQTVGSS